MYSYYFDDNWFLVEVKMKLENFFMKFKNPSHYYRCLSQGNWNFLKKSNRLFFRHFSDGMYRSVIDEEKVCLIFLLRVKNNSEKYRISKELSIRMKKLMNSPIYISDIREMSETDRKLLSSKSGINYYNRILGNRVSK
jgi:hypothetical protein